MRSSASFSKRRQSTGLQAAVENGVLSRPFSGCKREPFRILAGRAAKATLCRLLKDPTSPNLSKTAARKTRSGLVRLLGLLRVSGKLCFCLCDFLLVEVGTSDHMPLSSISPRFSCLAHPLLYPVAIQLHTLCHQGARLARHCGMRGGLRHRGKGSRVQ